MTQWSHYQEAIFTAVRDSQDNLVIMARAGSGKTTTIVESLKHLDRNNKILLAAFNKKIQEALKARCPRHVEVKTIHALGYAILARRISEFSVDADKARKIIRHLTADHFNTLTSSEATGKLMRLTGLAKNTLVGLPANDSAEAKEEALFALADLAERYDLSDEDDHPAEKLAEVVAEVLAVCRDPERKELVAPKTGNVLKLTDSKGLITIDFDDMIWLPPVLGYPPACYDVVLVDESQDLNEPQIWMISQALRRGGRIIAVGDDKQAIYGWRGAGSGVINRLVKTFSATTMPLPITYRCPLLIVQKAQKIVPDLEPAPNAAQGVIGECTLDQMFEAAQPGDFILSRLNAPLTSACLTLLKARKPAVIAGRDIGKSLIELARKGKKSTVPEMSLWLEKYLDRERDKLTAQGKEDRLDFISDKVSALLCLSDGCLYVEDVVKRIETIFSDDSENGKIVLSTVHKAKGLERRKVWLLADTFRPGRTQEESNILYVAITRAQEELHYVYDPNAVKPARRN